MELALIEVSGVTAKVSHKSRIPKGIIGAIVRFQFTDPAWNDFEKMAVFQGVCTKDVLIQEDTAVIPHEVVSQADVQLKVGVYGTNAEKNTAIPTLWANLGFIKDAADPSGDSDSDDSLPIWAQIQREVSDLKENGSNGTPGSNAVGITNIMISEVI